MNRMQLAWAALCLFPAWAQAVTCQNNIPASNPDSIYIVHGDGTITDTRTGLMWKQCLEGQNAQDNCAGSGSAMTWAASLAHAEGHTFAGHSDWRLPNLKELRSLVEECKTVPSINDTVFPGTPDVVVWSGSPSAGGSNNAWSVNFYYGYANNSYNRNIGGVVRLVRAGQSFSPLPALSAVALQGTPTDSNAAVQGTSTLVSIGWWLVVPRGSAAPMPAQVKNPSGYAVTPVAQGSAAMLANAPASFAIGGLTAATNYDFYLVADAAGQLSTPVQKVEFTTAAAPVAGACGSAHNVGSTPLLASAPSGANLCGAGAASGVTGGTSTWGWTCVASTTATCQAPRGYTVSTLAGAGGSIGAAQTVAYNATAQITVTPAVNYVVDAVTGCGGSLLGTTFTTGAVTAHCTVSATFKAASQPTVLTLPEGPYAGQSLTVAAQAANSWQITQASTQTVASLGAPALPPGVTLPHGVVRLRLEQGTQGTAATVVLTYPQPLPPSARYYKYGKTAGNSQPHWYVFPGAAISGSTVTLTLVDGGAGDDDLAQNSVINDPGGVGLGGTAAAIPTLSQWGVALLAGLLGLLSLGALRRRVG